MTEVIEGTVVHHEEPNAIEELLTDYQQAKADQAELENAKHVLALAISRLPKQQLKVSLTDMAHFGELDLQMKRESKSGAILFRTSKATPVE